jgi:uncharacterized protein (DUF2141 family)
MSCSLDFNIISVSGDCSNSNLGAFELEIFSTSPGVALQMISPFSATSIIGTATTFTYSGLSAGTYTFYLFDSCPTQTSPFSVYISSGTCVSILSVQNTTCGFSNGTLTTQLQNIYLSNTSYFTLYEITQGEIFNIANLQQLVTFTTLSPGTYYVIADDGGGCTGKSESCIIKSSTTLNYGLYTINNSSCNVDTGAIYVTGLTGNPPYTYSWSNGNNTDSFITGLTEGIYSVVVTDNTGCSTVVSTNVELVPLIGITAMLGTPPSCFSGDGEVTVYISGGTAPYYYQGSNGETIITFSQSHTFTGLTSGIFSVEVTDAGLCTTTDSTTIQTPNSFYVVSIDTTNSTCNNNSGSVDIQLGGGSGFYTVSLTDSFGNTQTNSSVGSSTSFTTLASGTYTLQITNGGPCVYTQSITINNTIVYTLSTSTTGTTCNNEDGSVTLTISSGGTPPYLYQIGTQSDTSSSLSYTFYNLAAGNYTATVTDSNFCQQTSQFTITSSNNVNFNLSALSPTVGPTGQIDTFITSGEPPFSWTWSSNVPSGQTGLTITGLSAGTYVLTVTDDNGCTQTRSLSMFGYNLVSSYEVLNLCQDISAYNGEIGKRGPQQMLVEGFFDLTSGDTGCILNSAIFEVVVSGDSTVKTAIFYTGTSLNDFPTDDEYYDTLSNTLLQFDGIQSVDIDPLNNEIIINTICNPPVNLIDLHLTISLKIYYDISCISCSP